MAADKPLSRFDNPDFAPLLALFACLCFAGLGASAKHLTQDLHGFVVTFWRNFFGFAFMLPWLIRHGLGGLRTHRFPVYLFRSGMSVVSMLCGFTALAYLPLADATSLSFTAPLFATILAAIILKERVRIRRWSATFVGFIGVLVVTRPSLADFNLGEALVIVSAFLAAFVSIVVKDLARTETPQAIVTYMVMLATPMTLLPALFVWSWPGPAEWPFVILLGVFGTLGHLAWTRAFFLAEASAIFPYDYSRLVFATAIGIVWFGETPDFWFWVGSAIIVAAGLYIAQREAKLRVANALGTSAGDPLAVNIAGEEERKPS